MRRFSNHPSLATLDIMIRSLASAALALSLFTVSLPSLSYERQWKIGAGLGMSGLAVTEADPFTFRLIADGSYGLTDTYDLIGRVSFHMPHQEGGAIGLGEVGVAYVIDILQWVPYFGIVGLVGVHSDETTQLRAGLGLPFGIDYLVRRDFQIGAYGQLDSLFISSDGSNAIGGLSAGLRAAYVWGN